MFEFAQWRYHTVHGAKLFTSEASVVAAGREWRDHPDAPVPDLPPIVPSYKDKSPVEIVAELPKLDPVAFTPFVVPAVTEPDEPTGFVVGDSGVVPDFAPTPKRVEAVEPKPAEPVVSQGKKKK